MELRRVERAEAPPAPDQPTEGGIRGFPDSLDHCCGRANIAGARVASEHDDPPRLQAAHVQIDSHRYQTRNPDSVSATFRVFRLWPVEHLLGRRLPMQWNTLNRKRPSRRFGGQHSAAVSYPSCVVAAYSFVARWRPLPPVRVGNARPIRPQRTGRSRRSSSLPLEAPLASGIQSNHAFASRNRLTPTAAVLSIPP